MVCSGLIQRLQRAILQCKYAKDCRYYRQDSFTCNEGDQIYCEKYRIRSKKYLLVKMTIPRRKGEGSNTTKVKKGEEK